MCLHASEQFFFSIIYLFSTILSKSINEMNIFWRAKKNKRHEKAQMVIQYKEENDSNWNEPNLPFKMAIIFTRTQEKNANYQILTENVRTNQ